MKISFLLPSKNRLVLLRHAVASILAQDYRDIEIVISDNASDQDYRSYVEELSDPRIVYSRIPSAVSVTENWRNALSLSTGEYFLMMGDDDALVPNFAANVLPYLSPEKPDLLYLAAYHYAYPEVLPSEPRGYLAVVRNSEFLIENTWPFSLTSRYAQELAASVVDFRYRFGFNAQHFLLNAAFVKQFDNLGSIYQSPYPDTFAAITVLAHASSVTVVPKESVIIGISPHSFGAYYFSNRDDEGYQFLDNERLAPEVRASLSSVVLPGDRNNTNWLIAAEAARRVTVPSRVPQTNVGRYRALQAVAVLRSRYLLGFQSVQAIAELSEKLSSKEKATFALLESAVRSAASVNRRVLVKVFTAIDRELEQFTPATIIFLDIGLHSNIEDAVRWLAKADGAQPPISAKSAREEPGRAEELVDAIAESQAIDTELRVGVVAVACLAEALLLECEQLGMARLVAREPWWRFGLRKIRNFIVRAKRQRT